MLRFTLLLGVWLVGEVQAQCADKATNCADLLRMCDSRVYEQILKENCAQTCKHCPGDCTDRARRSAT